MSHSSCRCNTAPIALEPLWSLCQRDRFCPWCGGQVRRLTSQNFFESDQNHRLLILYVPVSTEDTAPLEFRASTLLEFHDARHQRLQQTSSIPGMNGSQPVVTLNLFNPPARLAFDCCLEAARPPTEPFPAIVLKSRGGSSDADRGIPESGVDGVLKLHGDFPDEEWTVLLCREPHLVCSLQNRGIRPRSTSDLDSAGRLNPRVSHWDITDTSLLRLTLTIKVAGAPIYVAREAHPIEDDGAEVRYPARYKVTVKDQDGAIKLKDEFKKNHAVHAKTPPLLHLEQTLRPGQQLQPTTSRHNAPFSIPIQLNCTDLQPGWVVELTVEIDRAGEPETTLTHTLKCYCVDLGKISIGPSQISLTSMFAGEYRSNASAAQWTNPEGAASQEAQKQFRLKPVIDKIEVSNEGKNKVGLRPVIKGQTNVGQAEWIRVGWDVPSSIVDHRVDSQDPSRITLEPGESCQLLIELDFRHVMPQDVPLKSRIVLEDSTDGTVRNVELGELAVLIQRVEPRTPADSPLFLDFGNSNTTAAVLVKLQGGQPSVRPGHDYGNSEHFPTALLLTRVYASDPPGSECLIGPFAVQKDDSTRGPDNLSRLVSGLKQRLCQLPEESFAPAVSCVDLHDEQVWMTSSNLLTLFLREMIRRAETLLRGKYLQRLVISYPARLSPAQRRSYFDAFQSACRRISDDPDRKDYPLTLEDQIKVDEANAVALGFVYRPDPNQTQAIEECLKRNNGRMRVAAIDLGGGSLDIACLEFLNQSQTQGSTLWQSRYLWIGGNIRFGGNNLTAATFEILQDGLERRLAAEQSSDGTWLDRLREIPSPDDYFQGRAAHRAARFAALWGVADSMKLAALTSGGSRHVDAIIRPLATALQLDQEIIRKVIDEHSWPTLNEIEQHRIRCDQHGQSDYVIAARLEQSIAQLAEEMHKLGQKIDFVVVGGGASPWPLLREIIAKYFSPPTVIVYEPRRLKSRVADGLALSWSALSSPKKEDRPACSGNYTTAEIGILDPYGHTSQSIFPICTPIRDGKQRICWHPLRLVEHPVVESTTILRGIRKPLSENSDRDWELTLCRLQGDHSWEALGRFSTQNAENPPPDPVDWTEVEIGFRNDEDDLVLKILAGETTWTVSVRPL